MLGHGFLSCITDILCVMLELKENIIAGNRMKPVGKEYSSLPFMHFGDACIKFCDLGDQDFCDLILMCYDVVQSTSIPS